MQVHLLKEVTVSKMSQNYKIYLQVKLDNETNGTQRWNLYLFVLISRRHQIIFLPVLPCLGHTTVPEDE